MPSGLVQRGAGVIAPSTTGEGDMQWRTMTGIDATNPLVGGPYIPGLQPTDVDRHGSVVVSLPNTGSSATGTAAGAPGVHLLDDWRDLFNFSGSPLPWLLLLTAAMLGFAQLAVSARVGPARAAAGIG